MVVQFTEEIEIKVISPALSAIKVSAIMFLMSSITVVPTLYWVIFEI